MKGASLETAGPEHPTNNIFNNSSRNTSLARSSTSRLSLSALATSSAVKNVQTSPELASSTRALRDQSKTSPAQQQKSPSSPQYQGRVAATANKDDAALRGMDAANSDDVQIMWKAAPPRKQHAKKKFKTKLKQQNNAHPDVAWHPLQDDVSSGNNDADCSSSSEDAVSSPLQQARARVDDRQPTDSDQLFDEPYAHEAPRQPYINLKSPSKFMQLPTVDWLRDTHTNMRQKRTREKQDTSELSAGQASSVLSVLWCRTWFNRIFKGTTAWIILFFVSFVAAIVAGILHLASAWLAEVKVRRYSCNMITLSHMMWLHDI